MILNEPSMVCRLPCYFTSCVQFVPASPIYKDSDLGRHQAARVGGCSHFSSDSLMGNCIGCMQATVV